MTDPKVVHPATENRIDLRNHDFDGPADMLSEDIPELFKQRTDPVRWTKAVDFGLGEAESPSDGVLPALQSLAGDCLTSY